MTSLTPFISRDDLRDVIGRDEVLTDDGALIAIDGACDMVRSITEQDFNATTGTAVLDGTGTDSLVLPQLPVTKVHSVTVGGTVSSGTITGGSAIKTWTVRSDGVLLRTAGAATTDSFDDSQMLPLRWPQGRQNVTVVYDSGFGTALLPRDVRLVALEIARRIVVQGNAMSETVGPVSMRYAVAATDFTKGELMILRKHRLR